MQLRYKQLLEASKVFRSRCGSFKLAIDECIKLVRTLPCFYRRI